MRIVTHCCLAALLALSAVSPSAHAAESITSTPVHCPDGQRQIDLEGYVRIGGIDQWVTIKGNDCTNPVILFVHGGPGNPNTVYAKLPYAAWEKDFTLVQWDQRGAGRTFIRNPASADDTLTIEALAKDGTDLASHIANHLKTKKLILFGSSWGSALAVHMASARPELFSAYIGTGQLVNGRENETASYRRLIALARTEGDATTVAAMEALGEPPWTNPRHPGAFRRLSRVYEAKTSAPAPKSWWALAPEYATEKMQADYERGEDYSWIQYVGLKGGGMHATLDLYKLGAEFKLPVFLIQGEQDLVTTPEVARRYFDTIRAPRKEYFLLPATGHAPNPAMIEAQFNILKSLTRSSQRP